MDDPSWINIHAKTGREGWPFFFSFGNRLVYTIFDMPRTGTITSVMHLDDYPYLADESF